MFRLRRKKKSSDPVAVVQRFVDAANRHDALAISECLHPDFDSMQPIYPSRNFRGADQVRRNWQAIFQSEPGFRLTLLRSAVADGTVWIELHGAGKEVEVAGVFIMGVENNLVRWARVYSAVVDQEFQGPVDTGEAPVPTQVDDDGVRDAQVAAELREMIDAGRHLTVVGESEPERVAEPEPVAAAEASADGDDTVLWAPAGEGEEDAGVPSELATGEVPVVAVSDEEPPATERTTDELEPVVMADPPEEAPEPEPVVTADPSELEPVTVDATEPEPQPEPEPEPVMADAPEPELEPFVMGDAAEAPEPESEPVAMADLEPAPELEPEVMAGPDPGPVAPGSEEPAPTAEPEPVVAAEEGPPGGDALDELLEPSYPPPGSPDPVVDLVSPDSDAPTDDEPPAPAAPEEEHAVLELKPERRFRRLPRPSGRRP